MNYGDTNAHFDNYTHDDLNNNCDEDDSDIYINSSYQSESSLRTKSMLKIFIVC